MNYTIETERLKIIPLTQKQLKSLLKGTPVLERELGLDTSGLELDKHTHEAMTYLHDLAQKTPDAYPWITNWQIILKGKNISFGSACFMNVPNTAGEVEIGYGIHPPFQNFGYMTEALDAICKWAFKMEGVSIITAESDPENIQSHRVLKKCGFIQCGKTHFVLVSGKKQPDAEALVSAMKASGSLEDAVFLQRFFKTGKGQYGEGDIFLGIRNPQTRLMAKTFRSLPLDQIQILLKNKMHEIRLCALLIMVGQYERGDEKMQSAIFKLYRKMAGRCANNWDLVDLSAPDIVGAYALSHGKEVIEYFADSNLLWEQRIAIVSTLTLIRHNDFSETLRIAERFLSHPHDLIHKAVGWMLREVGKRNRSVLTDFVMRHKSDMPRTMLRYAIEHYPEHERKEFMRR